MGLAGCDRAQPLAGCDAADGIPVVASTGPGVWEREGIEPRLTELWRAGGLNEGQELAFPAGFAVSPTGRVAIPDFQLGEVVVIEADGTWRGPVTRQGPGPGELATPVAVSWGADGRLVVFDVVAPKVLMIEGDSAVDEQRIDPSFTAPIVMGGEIVWAGVQPDGATLVQLPPRPVAGEGEPGEYVSLILRLGPGESVPDTVARALVPVLEGEGLATSPVPGWPRPMAAVGGGGRLAVGGEGDAYRIRVHDASGRPLHRVCRDAEPLPLRDDERGEIADPELRELAAAIQAAPRPATPAPYGRLVLGADGRLWVQRERPGLTDRSASLYGRAGALHDVFDADGRYLGEVRLPQGAHLQGASSDTLWTFEFGEFDEVWVVAYQLELE